MRPEEAKKEAKKISDWIIDIRRELHKHPELMYEEVKTQQYLLWICPQMVNLLLPL